MKTQIIYSENSTKVVNKEDVMRSKIRKAVFDTYTTENFKMTEEKRNYVFNKVIAQFGHEYTNLVTDAISFFIQVDNGLYDMRHSRPITA